MRRSDDTDKVFASRVAFKQWRQGISDITGLKNEFSTNLYLSKHINLVQNLMKLFRKAVDLISPNNDPVSLFVGVMNSLAESTLLLCGNA